MTEMEEYLARERKKAMQRQQGLGTHQLTVSPYNPQWEQGHTSLPAYMNYRTLLQDPATGKFLTMPGIDGDPVDPLGRT